MDTAQTGRGAERPPGRSVSIYERTSTDVKIKTYTIYLSMTKQGRTTATLKQRDKRSTISALNMNHQRQNVVKRVSKPHRADRGKNMVCSNACLLPLRIGNNRAGTLSHWGKTCLEWLVRTGRGTVRQPATSRTEDTTKDAGHPCLWVALGHILEIKEMLISSSVCPRRPRSASRSKRSRLSRFGFLFPMQHRTGEDVAAGKGRRGRASARGRAEIEALFGRKPDENVHCEIRKFSRRILELTTSEVE
ncbi:hypothetical protein EVAR_54339_1 [Eumeta japonica]|uniref:Uncharacterized protein n=1 Tax=Eumeta variegata TaxID=151549 RepID=A0A4C1Y8S7_EUMVA|nr:hypothetical protein EVAR_54339_1 [Eumeta japonica]